jgi:heptosyltransferase-2
MRSIALFLPNWIGDVVMATPAIRAVRQSFPTSRIVAVGLPYVREVVGGSPRIDRFIPSEKRKPLDLIRELRRERIDGALLFSNSFRTAALARLAGCRTLVGFARYGRDLLLSKRIYAKRNRMGGYQPTPVLDDYNRLAERFGCGATNRSMELFTTSADESLADEAVARLGLRRYPQLVGLNPGGAFGASKHWPHFAELAKVITERTAAGVVVLGGPSERAEARRIAGAANHPNVVHATDGPLSIGLTKALVKRLTLLVTTDSGPRHFATAFGVPTITLGWTETYSPVDTNLQLAMPCGPCQQRQCPLGHHRCMTDLAPERVWEAVEPILARRLRRAC